MASQLARVTGNKRLRYDPRAGLQAKIARLPQMMQQRQQKQIIARDTAFQNKQIAFQKEGATQRKREEEAAMGLEATKLGLNIGMSDMGRKTIGDITAGAKNAYSGVLDKFSKGPARAKAVPGKGMFSNVNVGGALASGLTGYGIGKLVGGKNKVKKSLYGGGAGALMGMLSSGKGGGFGGMIAGGLTGGLGGYFS